MIASSYSKRMKSIYMGISNFRTSLLVLCVLIGSSACAPPPPNLTPQAAQAFQNTRVIKGLDVLRDFAIDANAATPPVLSTAVTRKVVLFHESALKIINAAGSG